MITETHEPIRPLRCKESPAADSATLVFGTVMTFYGESHWPSRSYSIWFHRDMEG